MQAHQMVEVCRSDGSCDLPGKGVDRQRRCTFSFNRFGACLARAAGPGSGPCAAAPAVALHRRNLDGVNEILLCAPAHRRAIASGASCRHDGPEDARLKLVPPLRWC